MLFSYSGLKTLSHNHCSCQIVKLNNFGSNQVFGKLRENLGRDVSKSSCSALALRVFPVFCCGMLLRCCELPLPTSTLEMAISEMSDVTCKQVHNH